MPPLDHYVSQVHLKNFYSPALRDRMFAMRKSDLKEFTPNAQSVCRTDEGSTNTYLRDPRIIEEFLKSVELRYNRSIQKLNEGKIDNETIYVIAGFASFVISCSPAGMRILSRGPQAMTEELLISAEARGDLPVPPEELAGRSLIDILRSGDIKIEIDPKYPQALGIAYILRFVQFFGNSAWEILVNPFNDSPFFTSDYPIAVEASPDPRVMNRIVPLSPFLAVRIMPDISISRKPLDFSFKKFRFRTKILSHSEVVLLNRLLVRSAENAVFYREEHDWVRKFIEKNRDYRIDHAVHEFSGPDGKLVWLREQIVKFSREKGEHTCSV